jgi:hypothetical protein
MGAVEKPPDPSGELPHYPLADDDGGAGTDQHTPRWVFPLVIVGVVLIVVLLVVLHRTGIMGPGLHQ